MKKEAHLLEVKKGEVPAIPERCDVKEFMCSRCFRLYTFEEYRSLPRVPANAHSYVPVCECGARFHLDKWGLKTRVLGIKTPHGLPVLELTVSTVALEIRYPDDMWYETMLFADWLEDSPIWRYKTQAEAEEGHRKIVDALKSGKYEVEPCRFRLKLLDEGEKVNTC